MKKNFLFFVLVLCLIASCSNEPPHTHSYVASVIQDATCTEPGLREYRCSCGDSYTEEIAAAGHSWNEGIETVAPTCTTPGTKTFTCSVCSETKEEEIATLPHTWDEGVETVEPTCTEPGTMTYTCSVCQITREEGIESSGHVWGEGVSTATCTAPGTTTYTCIICSDTSVEDAPALEHDFVGIQCSRCGEYSVTISEVATEYTDSTKTDGLKLTLNTLTHDNVNGYNRYTINYTLENIIPGSIGEPGIFKIIWINENGYYNSEFQTGTMGYLYYPNSMSRSYTWTLAGSAQFVCIEYIPMSLMTDYIFSETPTDNLLNWVVE